MTRFDNGQPAKPGDLVQKGFTVNLTWSDNSQFTLPNITQQKPEDAVKTLNGAGWAGDLSTLQTGATEVETSEPDPGRADPRPGARRPTRSSTRQRRSPSRSA